MRHSRLFAEPTSDPSSWNRVDGGAELAKDFVLFHIHLRLVFVTVHASSVGAAVVVVRHAARFRFRGVRNLAAALFAREREGALRKHAVVLQFPIERSLAERLA